MSREAPSPYSNEPRITLSGLLNVLDGVASPWGRILIMTTNHVEKLDDALTRHGRADKHFYIGHLTKQSAKDMFLYRLGDDQGMTNQDGHKETKDAADGRSEHSNNDSALLEKMAEKFSQNIPEDLITPAKLGSYLLLHRGDPAGACSNIAEWVAEEQERQTEAAKARGSGNYDTEVVDHD